MHAKWIKMHAKWRYLACIIIHLACIIIHLACIIIHLACMLNELWCMLNSWYLACMLNELWCMLNEFSCIMIHLACMLNESWCMKIHLACIIIYLACIIIHLTCMLKCFSARTAFHIAYSNIFELCPGMSMPESIILMVGIVMRVNALWWRALWGFNDRCNGTNSECWLDEPEGAIINKEVKCWF